MSAGSPPAYDLAVLQSNVKGGWFIVRGPAFDGALALGFDRTDIVACIAQLDDSDFYKTMASETKQGLMQDVYRPMYLGQALYVKVQLDPPARTVIISFKKDESR